MTRYGMILVGLLSGGDYGPGLRGFGQHISHGLARYGYGDTLCLAEQSLTPERFDTFLVQWREDLRQALLHDPAHHLGRSRPALAALVTDRFPGDTLALYLHPVTSRDTGVQPPAILRQAFRPSLSSLAVMCERYFGWDQCTIYDKFKKLVWPGHILRNMMMAATNLENVVQRRQIQDSATDRAVEYLAWIDSEANTTRGSYTTRTKFDIHWRKIIMPTKRLAIRTLDSIDDIGPQPASRIGSGTTDVIALWVPSYLFNDFDLLVSRVTSPVPDILEASRPVEHVAPAGQAGPSRILIDLTLSDDEDGPSTKGGHTGRVLPFVPGTDGIIDLT
ncbi:hypothetical protein PLICRDRAFT_261117 [Plicaturopsis crispa FD-325 SS-3]|nr:hypothetical protein PLICRDRAFT_261117 [Plicaturopsis crispa FD-325 SS-3]